MYPEQTADQVSVAWIPKLLASLLSSNMKIVMRFDGAFEGFSAVEILCVRVLYSIIWQPILNINFHIMMFQKKEHVTIHGPLHVFFCCGSLKLL